MQSARVRILITLSAATVLAVFGVAGSSQYSGPVLITFSNSHGIHRDDLVIVVCWLAILGACIWEWATTRE